MTDPSQEKALGQAIPSLALTQMIGWGTTYYLPAVLGKKFEADLGLSDGIVFGAVAVMLIVSALVSWPMGKLIDRLGARAIMVPGSVVFAAGLFFLAFSQGVWSYLLSWAAMGIGMTMALANAAFGALSQIAGKDARAAIGKLMLFGGMAATFFWPLTLWLDSLTGWRNTCLLYAAVHFLLCMPMHWFFLPSPDQRQRIAEKHEGDVQGLLPAHLRKKAAILMVLAIAGNGFVSWGLDLHIINILTEFGLGVTAAVAVAALKGPATLLARGVDVLSVGRVTPMTSAIAGALLFCTGLISAIQFGKESYGPVLFIIIFSFGTGLMSIARATMPLTLLGAVGYATTLGRFALPTQLVYAVAPMLFGLMIEAYGVQNALIIGLMFALSSLLALFALARMATLSTAENPHGLGHQG